MEFIILAYDGTDAEALKRRMAVREEHMRAVREEMIPKGEARLGGALLGEGDTMIGSLMVVDFPSRQAVDDWLAREVYVTGEVWQRVEVIPFRTAPPFLERSQPSANACSV